MQKQLPKLETKTAGHDNRTSQLQELNILLADERDPEKIKAILENLAKVYHSKTKTLTI